MSWTLVTAATPIDPATLPPDAAWTYDTIAEALNQGTHANEILMSTSRNGALLGNLKPLIDGFGLRALAVFDTAPWDAPDDAIGTVLHPQDLAALGAEVDAVFEAVATDPDSVLATGLESCCARHLQEHAALSEASLDPLIEDGGDLRSLFNFLRSVQALCRRSQADGRLVLVAQLC